VREGAWPLFRGVPGVEVGVVELDLDQPPVQKLGCNELRARQHPHAPLPCLLGHRGDLAAQPLGRLGQLGRQRARAPARTRLNGGVPRRLTGVGGHRHLRTRPHQQVPHRVRRLRDVSQHMTAGPSGQR